MRKIFWAACGFFLLSCGAVFAADAYTIAKPNYHWQFPTDHGAHPNYKTEWWYYVGHLKDTQGKRYGFELAFFRVGLDRTVDNPSTFTPRDLYFSHFAVSDLGAKKFWYAESLLAVGGSSSEFLCAAHSLDSTCEKSTRLQF